MRKGFNLLAVLLLVSLTAASYTEADAGGANEPARVTYISGASIYVGAGRDRGLRQGDELQVVRDGQLISLVRINELSRVRASCTVIENYPVPEVGDIVRLPFDEQAGPAETADPGTETEGASRTLAFARISHINQETVFIDAGHEDDLRGGDRLPVLRGGEAVAILEVTDVSADRSACKVVDGLATLEAGEIVQLPVRSDVSGVVHQSSLVTNVVVRSVRDEDPDPRGRPRASHVSGRVGLRYLSVRDHNDAGGDLSQPALDLRLDGRDLVNKHADVAVDVRSRRTYRPVVDASGEVTDQTRLYRLSASVHDPDSRYRLTVGRQYSPLLASVSTFDGILFDYNGDRWASGMFAGTQPAPEDYGYSDEIKEYGAFIQAHNRKSTTRPWSLTMGAVGSYQLGEVNREFVYLQALYTGPRLTFYATEEVDYNRDWKRALGEDTVTFSSSYVHTSVRAGGGFTLRAGYDNRRNIRLYRDFIDPAVEFDDSFRRGAWVGFTQRIRKRFRFGLDAKDSRSETAGNAATYTMTMGLSGLSKANFSSYYRGTRYSNDSIEGWLHSLNGSVSVTRYMRLILTGGVRDNTNLLDPTLDSRLVWYGAEIDLNAGRHWYFQLSGERNESSSEGNDQVYLSATYRF